MLTDNRFGVFSVLLCLCKKKKISKPSKLTNVHKFTTLNWDTVCFTCFMKGP